MPRSVVAHGLIRGVIAPLRLYKRGIVRGIDMEMVYTGAKPDEKATRVGRIKCQGRLHR